MKERYEKVLSFSKEISNLNDKKDSNVSHFKGRRGILSILHDILAERKEFCIFGNVSQSDKLLEHIPSWFNERRLELKMAGRRIGDIPRVERFSSKKYRKLTQVRTNKLLKKISTICFIYADKVAIFSNDINQNGFIIKDKNIFEMYKVFFEHLWRSSKPYNPE